MSTNSQSATHITRAHLQGFDCAFAFPETPLEANEVEARLKREGYSEILTEYEQPVGWIATGRKPLREAPHG